MELTIEVVVFWVLLVDALGANLMSWTSGKKWYQKHFRIMSRYLPMTQGWTTYYLILVLWMGAMIWWI